MATTNFTQGTVIESTWLNDVDKVTYNNLNGRVIRPTDEEFGAVGDGITDDSTALQAAINYAGSLSGITTGPIVIIDLVGKIYGLGTPLSFDGISNVKMTNGQLIAVGSDWTSEDPIVKIESTDTYLVDENVFLSGVNIDCNFKASGVLLSNHFRPTIEDCYIYRYCDTGPSYGIKTEIGADTATQWSSGLTVSFGDVIEPTTPNGYYYRALFSGTTEATEPTWETCVGSYTETTVGHNYFCIGKALDKKAGDALIRRTRCEQFKYGVDTVTDYTGIGFFIESGDMQIDSCKGNRNRIGLVAGGINNQYSKLHFFNGVSLLNTITGIVINGSGKAQVTTASSHGFKTNDVVGISGVTGATEANDLWVVTKISDTEFQLNDLTSITAYVSGGSCKRYNENIVLYNGGGQHFDTCYIDSSVFVDFKLKESVVNTVYSGGDTVGFYGPHHIFVASSANERGRGSVFVANTLSNKPRLYSTGSGSWGNVAMSAIANRRSDTSIAPGLGRIALASGTALSPSLIFGEPDVGAQDWDTGLFQATPNTVSVAVGGAENTRWVGGGQQHISGSSTSSTYQFVVTKKADTSAPISKLTVTFDFDADTSYKYGGTLKINATTGASGAYVCYQETNFIASQTTLNVVSCSASEAKFIGDTTVFGASRVITASTGTNQAIIEFDLASHAAADQFFIEVYGLSNGSGIPAITIT